MAPYITPEQVRSRLPGTPDDDEVAELVAEFEQLIEGDRGIAYTPREVTEVHAAHRRGVVVLDWPAVIEVTAVTDASGAWSSERVAAVGRSGAVRGVCGEVTVTYRHGMAVPPPAVLRACREFVREKLTRATARGRRAVAETSDDSGTTYTYAGGDSLTGVPEVDRIVAGLPSYRTVVA